MPGYTPSTDAVMAAPLAELLDADLPTRVGALELLCAAIANGDIQQERDQHSGPELGELSVRTHRALTRVRGKQYQWLAVEEADGIWAASEFHPRTYASYVAHTHSISYGSARRQVRLARQLRDEIPEFGAALRAGRIGPDHVDAFASTALTSATRVAALGEEVQLGEETAIDDDAQSPGSRQSPEPGEPECAEDPQPTGQDPDRDAGSCVTVESFLLDQARDLRPDQVRRLGKHFAQVADPEADERGYREAKQREYLELARTLDGWHLSGFLTEENGRLVRTAMDAVMSPPAPDDQRTGDQRRAQALADIAHLVLDRALAGTHASVQPHLGVLIGPDQFQRLLRQAHQSQPPAPGGCADGPARPDEPADQITPDEPTTPDNSGDMDKDPCASTSHAGSTQPRPPRTQPPPGEQPPRVQPPPGTQRPPAQQPPPGGRSHYWDTTTLAELATIDWATRLREQQATFDDGTGPVPPALLRRLATCGDVYRVLFSPDNEIINHGRAHRLFTPAQRRALIARDHGCTWPGCTAPPTICESHHARIHWADGGRTDLTNGALLCYHHHDIVDQRAITMTRLDGTWTFTHPDGTTLGADQEPWAPNDWTLSS